MTLTDVLNQSDNIKANQAQYDLGQEAAKISALSSKKLDKYEYMTGEGLGYKPGVVEQAKLNIFHSVKFLIRNQKRKIRMKNF